MKLCASLVAPARPNQRTWRHDSYALGDIAQVNATTEDLFSMALASLVAPGSRGPSQQRADAGLAPGTAGKASKRRKPLSANAGGRLPVDQRPTAPGHRDQHCAGQPSFGAGALGRWPRCAGDDRASTLLGALERSRLVAGAAVDTGTAIGRDHMRWVDGAVRGSRRCIAAACEPGRPTAEAQWRARRNSVAAP